MRGGRITATAPHVRLRVCVHVRPRAQPCAGVGRHRGAYEGRDLRRVSAGPGAPRSGTWGGCRPVPGCPAPRPLARRPRPRSGPAAPGPRGLGPPTQGRLLRSHAQVQDRPLLRTQASLRRLAQARSRAAPAPGPGSGMAPPDPSPAQAQQLRPPARPSHGPAQPGLGPRPAPAWPGRARPLRLPDPGPGHQPCCREGRRSRAAQRSRPMRSDHRRASAVRRSETAQITRTAERGASVARSLSQRPAEARSPVRTACTSSAGADAVPGSGA